MDIALVYLASGKGRRFGSNKLLCSVGGRPLYQYGWTKLQRLQAAFGYRLLAVTAYPEILMYCNSQGGHAVYNEQADEGMAASVRLGVQYVGQADAYAFFPADQPLLQYDSIHSFLQGFAASGKSAGAMTDGRHLMSPAVFSAVHCCELLQLHGDVGGRHILRAQGKNLWIYEPPRQELIDVDTQETLHQLQHYLPF
ncbi:nucleotidyltransferase family protein [uncultured Megasphaera sp.]|uniref:nucleotidyltransferase family protein n=1 Tax=uncultured Megasphaera sp. TaxID=165188 RepID=UPI00265B2D23|nr:nucleotidyltransferase family protein [uncultured Megasphaera sp.]